MPDKNNRNFNLPALLRVEDLDIRRIAKDNPMLRVGEYYTLLSNFMKNVPLAADTLKRISENEATSNDNWSMEFLKTLLEDIGCKKYTSVIKEIIKTGKMGHHKFATEHAQKLLEKINKLNTQISTAEKTETLPDDLDTDNAGAENDEAQVLSTVLLMLDHEEATRKMRILAIDDAPVMLKTISSVLSDEYKVYGMTNPTMLEKFLRQITPELFLLDYQMPECSGFDLVPVIRGFEEHKNTPIIFLTSLGTIEHVSAAYALGAVDFIVKPFQGNILREKIAKHIVRKKLF